MDDGCSPTVGILIFAGFVILDFVVFGFIAAIIQIILELKNADATKNQITEFE